MTWHVINKTLELTDTCTTVDSHVVVVGMVGELGLVAVSYPPFLGGAACDVVVDNACNGLATYTSLQNDQGASNSDSSSLNGAALSSESGGENET